MNFSEYQEKVKGFAVYGEAPKVIYSLFGLAGEIGEIYQEFFDVAQDLDKDYSDSPSSNLFNMLAILADEGHRYGKISKKIRDDKWKEEESVAFYQEFRSRITPELRSKLKKEIGDVLWFLADLSSSLDINLQESADGNISKLESRKARGVISGSGNDR